MIDIGTDRPGHSQRMLVAQALRSYRTLALFQFLEDSDVIVRSAAARELQIRSGRDVFDKACELLTSTKSVSREIGAFLMGQLGTPKRPFRKKSIQLLNELIERENDAKVVAAIIASLGHLKAGESLNLIVKRANDDSTEVRVCVAFALGYIYASVPRTTRTIARTILKELGSDSNRSVREWADLGLKLADSK